jgi:hypothetical protein
MPHGKGDGPPLIRPQQDSYGESLRIWWRCLLVHASRQLTDCSDQYSILQLRCVPPRLPVGARPEPLQRRPAPQRVPLGQLRGEDASGAQLDYMTTRYRGIPQCVLSGAAAAMWHCWLGTLERSKSGHKP